jgi:drug/metabolite transporter (DMT)-like permease
MSSHRIKAYLTLLVVAVLWGVATPVIKFTLGGIDPLSFLTYRFGISTVLGISLLVFTKAAFNKIKDNFPEVFLYSILSTSIALGLLFLGLNRTTVLDTILITAISPLVTALFGVLFLKEHITNQEKLGISLAFVGTLITILEPLFDSGFAIEGLAGNFLVFGYLISNGFSSVLSKKLVRKDVRPLDLSNISCIIGFITLLPLVLLTTKISNLAGTVNTLALPYQAGVFYMAIFSGTAAYALWIKGQKTIEISEAGVFSYLIPVFAAPLAVFWLGEKITIPFIIGALVIGLGVFIAEYKRR